MLQGRNINCKVFAMRIFCAACLASEVTVKHSRRIPPLEEFLLSSSIQSYSFCDSLGHSSASSFSTARNYADVLNRGFDVHIRWNYTNGTDLSGAPRCSECTRRSCAIDIPREFYLAPGRLITLSTVDLFARKYVYDLRLVISPLRALAVTRAALNVSRIAGDSLIAP